MPAPSTPSPSPPPVPDAHPAPEVSWRRLPAGVLGDQKRIWLFPAAVARGRHVLPVLAVVGVTGGLIAGDPYAAPGFRGTSAFTGFNRVFNAKATSAATVLAPLSLYGAGLLRHNRDQQTTALLATEALADAFVLSSVMKISTLRLRPSDAGPDGNFSDTFYGKGRSITGGSFPSGHTLAAFSVATVFARRYPQHRWVAWLAYGAAATIGLSRLTLQSHFPSDVFLGAALGYSIGRFAVLGR